MPGNDYISHTWTALLWFRQVIHYLRFTIQVGWRAAFAPVFQKVSCIDLLTVDALLVIHFQKDDKEKHSRKQDIGRASLVLYAPYILFTSSPWAKQKHAVKQQTSPAHAASQLEQSDSCGHSSYEKWTQVPAGKTGSSSLLQKNGWGVSSTSQTWISSFFSQ